MPDNGHFWAISPDMPGGAEGSCGHLSGLWHHPFGHLSRVEVRKMNHCEFHTRPYANHNLASPTCKNMQECNTWRIVDFGIAAKAAEETRIECTLRYAPPEVALALDAGKRTITVDAAIDVWALGVMAFDLLATHPMYPVGTNYRVHVGTNTVFHFFSTTIGATDDDCAGSSGFDDWTWRGGSKNLCELLSPKEARRAVFVSIELRR